MDLFTFELPPFDSKLSSSEEDEINITQQNFQFLSTFVATSLDEFGSTASSSIRYIYRDDRVESHKRLFDHYFSTESNPTFTPKLFERRFRMPRDLFLRIVGDIEMNYQYFQTTHDNLQADLIEHLEHLSLQYHPNNPNN
ncbi:hypothetical protein R6Q57_008860 [Mikania cordata]